MFVLWSFSLCLVQEASAMKSAAHLAYEEIAVVLKDHVKEFGPIGNVLEHFKPAQLMESYKNLNNHQKNIMNYWKLRHLTDSAKELQTIVGKQPNVIQHQLLVKQQVKEILRKHKLYDKPFHERSVVKFLKDIFGWLFAVGVGVYYGTIFAKHPEYSDILADEEKLLPPDSPVSGFGNTNFTFPVKSIPPPAQTTSFTKSHIVPSVIGSKIGSATTAHAKSHSIAPSTGFSKGK